MTYEMIPEDAEQVVFNDPKFVAHRMEAEIVAWALLSPKNILEHILASETMVRAVEKLMQAIHNLVRREESRRKVVNSNTNRSS